jgi:type I restriction enzyme S subunit
LTGADTELPPGWCWANLGEVLGEVKNGVSETPRGDLGQPILRISAVRPMALDLSERRYLSSEGPWEDYLLRNGDLLFVRYNGNADLVGACAEVRGLVDRLVYPDKLIRGRTREAVPSYVAAAMRTDGVRDQIRSLRKSAAGQIGISGADLRSISIPMAPLAEQRRISARLDALLTDVRDAREQLAQVPRLVERLRRSVLAAAFRGDLTASWRAANPEVEPASVLLERIRAERRRRWEEANPRKRYVEPAGVDAEAEGLPELPEGWCWAALDEVADSVLGKMLDKAKNRGELRPYLRNINVRWDAVDVVDVAEMRFEEHEGDRYGLSAGDVVVCEGGEPGRAAVWDGRIGDMRFQKALHRVRCSAFVRPHWLVAQLRRHADSGLLSSYFTGSGIHHLTGQSLARVPVAVAPVQEQDRVLRVIGEASRAVVDAESAVAAAMQDVASFERALLTKAFRGELVAPDPSDEPAEAMLTRLRHAADPAPVKRSRRVSP